MKQITLLISTLFCTAALAQTKTDLAKELSSPERRMMIEALKLALQPRLKLTPKMVVAHLWVKGGFAFFSGKAKDGNGQNIDFKKTTYREALEAGAFGGDATVALLRNAGGKWKVLAFAVGPTDVPYTCWWKEFKAPKAIFDYTEDCQ